MSADRYEMAGYRAELRSQLLELEKHMWSSSDALNAQYFEWKYQTNPYVREPHLYVALLNGRPVAMRGMYGSRWEAGTPGASLTVLCGADLLVAPEHRGRGLAKTLMDFALADPAAKRVSYLFGLSAAPAARHICLATGWRSTGPLQYLDRLGHVSRWMRCRTAIQRAVGVESPASPLPFGRLDRYRRRSAGRLSERIFVTDVPRADAMADLIRRIGHDGRIRHVRDTTYLNWRFRNPRSTYRFFFLEDQRLQAYLVLQTRVGSLTNDVVRLVDWEGETPDARRAVLKAAFGIWVTAQAELSATAITAEDRTALLQVGFVARRIPSAAEHHPSILVRPITGAAAGPWLFNGRELLDLASWDMRPLYSDSA